MAFYFRNPSAEHDCFTEVIQVQLLQMISLYYSNPPESITCIVSVRLVSQHSFLDFSF